jgi:predicted DCC family thiol-disulfide oxidoreductase YuxK
MPERHAVYYLLYDEDCSLCVRFQAGVKKRDKWDRIETVGFMDPRIAELAPGLSREELVNDFHLVLPDGRILSGSRAMPVLLSLLPKWNLVGWLLFLPVARGLSDRIYLWISKRRK